MTFENERTPNGVVDRFFFLSFQFLFSFAILQQNQHLEMNIKEMCSQVAVFTKLTLIIK